MGHKKRRKSASRGAETAPREDATTIADPLGGTASIVPVTPDMMDHAAHDAAERVDAVARGSDAAAFEAADATDPASPSRPDRCERPSVAASREVSAPGDALGRYNAKALEVAASNLSAAGELVSALFGAQSPPEAAAINADHLRRLFDTMTSGGRVLMMLAQTLAFEAMSPPDDPSRKP